jgi:hypothetical protein
LLEIKNKVIPDRNGNSTTHECRKSKTTRFSATQIQAKNP